MSAYTGAYKQFFESPAGIELLTTISNMIDSEHEKAENNPELARDYTQRAKGVREVKNIISSMLIGSISLSETSQQTPVS